jgi:RNA polymerase sigma-70 factor, ECF subfamily
MLDHYNKPRTLITLGLPSPDVDFLDMLQKFIEREAERRQRIVALWVAIRIDGVHQCVIDSESWRRFEFEGGTSKVEIVGRDAEGAVVIATYLPTYDGPKTEAWKVPLPWGDEVSCTFEYDDEECVRVEAKRIIKPKLGEKRAQPTRAPQQESSGCDRAIARFVGFDRAYVERLREGDPSVEWHFVAYCWRFLNLKLRAHAVPSDTVDDLKQETFIRVITALRGGGEVREPLGTFVSSICNGVLTEYYPSLGNHQQIDETHRERVRKILSALAARDRDLLRAVLLEMSGPT